MSPLISAVEMRLMSSELFINSCAVHVMHIKQSVKLTT